MADGDVGFGRLEVLSGPTGRRRWPDEGNRPFLAALQNQAAAFSGMICALGVQFHGNSSSRRLLM